eukprot:6214794-Pleurochrysis_carterae.AAC.2
MAGVSQANLKLTPGHACCACNEEHLFKKRREILRMYGVRCTQIESGAHLVDRSRCDAHAIDETRRSIVDDQLLAHVDQRFPAMRPTREEGRNEDALSQKPAQEAETPRSRVC